MTQKKKKRKTERTGKKSWGEGLPSGSRSAKGKKPARADGDDSTVSLPLDRLSGRSRLLISVAILIVAVCLLYPELVFQNKVFLAGDTEAAASFATPIKKEIQETGGYPLWNPYLLSGMPSFASLSYTPYVYPVNFVAGLLARYLHFPNSTWLLLHAFLLGLGVYLLLVDRRVYFLIAVAAGILMMWMPNHVAVGANGHGSQMSAVAFIPFALLFWDRIWRGKSLIVNASALVIILGLQLLRAHVQISYYTFALIGLHFVFFGTLKIRQALTGKVDREYPTVIGFFRRALRREGVPARRVGVHETFDLLVVFVVVVVLALMISAVVFLPVKDFANYSIRGASEAGGLDYDYATSWSLHPLETLTFVIPSAFGYGKATYFGRMPFTDYPNYLGLVVVFFSVFAAFLARNRFVNFLLFVIVVTTLVSFGKHLPVLYNPLFNWLPYFNKFRVPVMVLIVQQFAFVLLFALGLQAVVAKRTGPTGDRIRKTLLWMVAGAALLFIIVVLTSSYWRGGFAESIAKNIRNVNSAAEQIQLARVAGGFLFGDLIKLSLILLVISGAGLLYARRTITVGVLLAVVIGAGLIDAYLVDLKIVHPETLYPETMFRTDQLRIIKDKSARDRFLEADDVIGFFETQRPADSGAASLFRVFPAFHPSAPLDRDPDFRTNRYMNFGISSLGGYHPAKLSIYQQFIDALGAAAAQSNYHLIDMLNAEYVITSYPFPDVPAFKLLWQGTDYNGSQKHIYRNENAFPRVYFVDRYRVMPPDEILGLLPSLPRGGIDLSETALLEEEPVVEPVSKTGAEAEIKAYSLNEIRIDARLPNPAILMLSEVFYPRWTAFVDGEAAQVIKANYILRAVALPAGEHEVVFRYDKSLVKNGLFVSVTVFALMLLLLLFAGVSEWRARGPRGAGVI
jgi:hypothetical protein